MIIVLFHAFYLFGKYVYENFYNRKEKTDVIMVTNQLLNVSEADYRDSNDDYDDNKHSTDNIKIKFFPPVYVQRYNTVQSVLTSNEYHGKIHKVIDFGCAELTFAVHLKNTDGIQEIYCVDVDRSVLENCQTKVAPLHCDYLSLRTEPLTIHVCEGSIAHNDNKLANTDAVICIELIEHLYPDDLEAFPHNVFGFIKPQVAIVTTPNADFNVLFRLHGFRHADHKFEWTRAQFQDWANNIVSRYPDYEVSFHGIGAGPGGTEHLGTCSQMAVFHRLIQPNDESLEGVDGLLKTVVSHKYPYRVDNRSDEEKMLAEAEYYIRLYSSRDEELSEEIPLKELMFSVEKFRISVDILRTILEEANWAIADRENGPVVLVPPQSTFSSNSAADYDDFLDNDYRHRDDNDDWDALEPGAPPSGYFFDSYMERDPQNHEEEENWDDEAHDTHRSSSSNLNSENLPNSELFASENVDRTSDNQWTMEDLNNEDPLLDASQHHASLAIDGLDSETELPSNSFLIGLDSVDLRHLDVSNDTLNSSERNLSSPLPLSDLSEVSHSMETDYSQSFSLNRIPTLSDDHFQVSSRGEKINKGMFVKGSKRLKLENHPAANASPDSSSLLSTVSENQMQNDNNDATLDNEERNAKFQTRFDLQGTEDDGKNCATQSEVYLPSNNRTRLLSKDSLIPCIETAATDGVDCNSARNDTSSILTVEATFLLSHEQSLPPDDKDPMLNARESLRNEESSDTGKKELNQSTNTALRACSTSLLLTEQSISENDESRDSQPLSTSNNLLDAKDSVSNLNLKDSSSATNKQYENLNLSAGSIDSSYKKCETDVNNTQKIETEFVKSQDSMSFKSISDCSLDIQPKYTSSPQVLTNICKIQDLRDDKIQQYFNEPNLHDYKSTPTLQAIPQTIQSQNTRDIDSENTYQSNVQKEARGALEVRSLSPKKNSLSTSDISTRDQNTLRKESSLEGKRIDEKQRIQNLSESITHENISPSTSQSSLKSNSDISLSTVTSTESSNVDKWYAAETNPMYQRDLVVLKGGNDTADNPNEEATSDSDVTLDGTDMGKNKDTKKNMAKILSFTAEETESSIRDEKITMIEEVPKSTEDMRQILPAEIQNSNRIASLLLTVQRTDHNAHCLPLDRSDSSSNSRPSGFSKQIGNEYFQTVDILGVCASERSQLQSNMSNCKSIPSYEGSSSCNASKNFKEKVQFKYENDAARGFETLESKPYSPESLDTPPDSWSPEIMDSGYPNSASVHDITPEYDLSSIANDRISDSDSASVGEAPGVQGFYEYLEVENGDLANNNRDDEGNNVIAFEADDLDDLQPLIDVLENDMENENDIYVLQNGFPLWLLRILEMANPIDLEGIGGQQAQQYHPAPMEQAGGDAQNLNADNDEGFDSSSTDDDSDIDDDDDEVDDATTGSSDETDNHNSENLRRDWRAGGDP